MKEFDKKLIELYEKRLPKLSEEELFQKAGFSMLMSVFIFLIWLGFVLIQLFAIPQIVFSSLISSIAFGGFTSWWTLISINDLHFYLKVISMSFKEVDKRGLI